MMMGMLILVNFHLTQTVVKVKSQHGAVHKTCKLQPIDERNRKLSSRISNCTALDAKACIQHIDDCAMQHAHDPNLLGHCKDCHLDVDACGSKSLYLHQLSPHFPSIRCIVNMLVAELGHTLQLGDLAGNSSTI